MYPECALCLWECWWTRGESRQKTTFCNTSGIIKRIFHLFLHVPHTCKFTFSRAGRCINITKTFTHLDNVWRQTELSRCLVSCLWTSLRSGLLGINLSEGNRISVIWGSICSHDLNRMIESDVQWAVRDSICAKCSGYSTCQCDKMLSKFSPFQCCSNVCQLSRTRSMTPWGNFQVQALFRKCIISFFLGIWRRIINTSDNRAPCWFQIVTRSLKDVQRLPKQITAFKITVFIMLSLQKRYPAGTCWKWKWNWNLELSRWVNEFIRRR